MSTTTQTAWDRLHATEPGLADELVGRVERGAALLDRVEPGWAARINCDRLAMESCNQCILGQLHGRFSTGFLLVLRTMPSMNLYSAAHHGFTLFDLEQDPLSAIGMYGDAPQARFAALGDLWRAEVRARTHGG
jgi:hypothetical protein